MTTKIKPDFSILRNDQLAGKLKQLASEFTLTYIFYHPAKAREAARIVIIAEDSGDVETIESRKWVRNSRSENTILFHISCQSKMKAELRADNPFFGWYCQKLAVIYQNPSAKECQNPEWPSFKKIFKRYTLAYNHDRDNLQAAVNRFQELGSLTGLFVSRNGNEYYLIFELEKANDFEEDGDEIRLNEKLMGSFSQAEEKLHKMVLSRLSELKALIKSGLPKQPFSDQVETTTEEDDEATEIAAQIVKIQPVEEIYLFHQIQNNQQTTNFLLLIGEGLGTETLNRIQQSVSSRFEGKYSVVLIGHSRSWIQANLFYQQAFFKKIMTPENLKFQSHPNHPSIHWEDNNTPEYPDLEYLNRSTINLSSQYFVLRNHSEKANTEGIFDLFGQSVLRIFRTLVYAKLSYLPNYLPAFNLWQLCTYADPGLEKLDYLFEKLSGADFFKEVNYHTRFHHELSRLTELKLLVADEILNTLMKELNTACSRIKTTIKEKSKTTIEEVE